MSIDQLPISVAVGIDAPVEHFANRELLMRRLQEEVQIWTDFKSAADSAPSARQSSSVSAVCQHQSRGWQKIVSAFFDASVSIPDLSSRIVASNLVGSRSPAGIKARDMSREDMNAAIWLIALARGTEAAVVVGQNNQDGLAQLFRAIAKLPIYSDVESNDARARARQAASDAETYCSKADIFYRDVRAMLATVTEEREKVAADVEHVASRTLKIRRRLVRDCRDAAIQQWEGLRESLIQTVQLGKAREYLDTKAVSHLHTAGICGLIFICTVILAIVYMVFAMEHVVHEVAEIKALSSLSWAAPALAIGLPLFLVLWLLRFSARLLGEHLLRREDAVERRMMVETYLALTARQGLASDAAAANFDKVLDSLFRPGPGFGHDHSPPIGLVDAMTKAAQRFGRPGGPSGA